MKFKQKKKCHIIDDFNEKIILLYYQLIISTNYYN